MRLRDLLRSLNHWSAVAARNRITFVHSNVGFMDLLRAYRRTHWGIRLESSLQKMRRGSFQFERIDVTEMLHRELEKEAWDLTIPQCLLLARAAQSLCARKRSSITSAMHAFEFQPVEKAFMAGVKLAHAGLPVIGLQTSLIGKSHLGYRFLPEQVTHAGGILPPDAPVPDYVATYGSVAYSMLEKPLGRKRVLKTGPVRYPYLRAATHRERKVAEANLGQRLYPSRNLIPVLLALTSLREESETIMNWALKIGQFQPALFFLVRFHYWADFSYELQDRASQIGLSRYTIDQGDLHEQLLTCRLMITGTSSIGVEAMISGCMPIVYRPHGVYAYGPISDVAEGAYFFSNEAELEASVWEVLQDSRGYRSRKVRWPKLLERHCYKLDGKSSARLYNWLVKYDVLTL
jgi:hypothetical protein